MILELPSFVHPTDSVFKAIREMDTQKSEFLFISEDGKEISGVMTESDIIRGIARSNVAFLKQRVGDITLSIVITCESTQTLTYAVTLMKKNKIRHLPIVMGNMVVGVLGARDVLREYAIEHDFEFFV